MGGHQASGQRRGTGGAWPDRLLHQRRPWLGGRSDALVKAIEAGTIAGAGLDVFEAEPKVPEALFNRRNVVLLPHVASATTKRDRRWPILPSKISPCTSPANR